MTKNQHNPKPKHVLENLLQAGADLSACDNIEVFIYHLNRVANEQIELVREGKMCVDEHLLNRFKEINQHLQEYGKPTVSLDFLN
jgi:enoyl-CoA hydratase/carnithine racemase